MNFFVLHFFRPVDLSRSRCERLYQACENNDLPSVEACLKKMTLTEIDFQHGPNNETVLHLATRKQQKEMAELLLIYGARASLRDAQGRQASELSESEEMHDLFKRRRATRYTFPPQEQPFVAAPPQNFDCQSCSLVNNSTMYEWELIDRNAAQKALEFRRELQEYAKISAKVWRRKFYSLKKGYLAARVQDLPSKIEPFVRKCFESALIDENPSHLLAAYTRHQDFSKLLNVDMARNVIHALKNGCSQFSCQCLYATQDGTETIASIFLHHPKFQKLAFRGVVYRGIRMEKCKLDHYKVGSCIITTTFLSTSTNQTVAQWFSGDGAASHADEQSFICTYRITTDSHTAINISEQSQFEEEAEILILPYSSFRITKIEAREGRIHIDLDEHSLLEILSDT